MIPLPLLQRLLLPVFIVIYAFLSLYVMAVFVPGSGYGINNNAGIPRPPLVYRPLVPLITKEVRAMIPDSSVESATAWLIEWRDSYNGNRILRINPARPLHFAIDNGHIFDTMLRMLVVYATLVAFIWMMYRLTAELLPQSRAYALLAPVVVMLHASSYLWRAAYTYDFAEMFFSCACFYFLYRREWAAYMVCLGFATFAKETAVFSALFFTIWFYHDLPRRQYFKLMLGQWAVYIGIEGFLDYIYSDRVPIYNGVTYMGQVKENFLHMINYDYLVFLATLVTGMLLTYKWQEKPLFLRAGMWLVVMNVAAFIAVCHPGEYRDLFWCLPIVSILMTHTLVRVAEADKMEMFAPV